MSIVEPQKFWPRQAGGTRLARKNFSLAVEMIRAVNRRLCLVSVLFLSPALCSLRSIVHLFACASSAKVLRVWPPHNSNLVLQSGGFDAGNDARLIFVSASAAGAGGTDNCVPFHNQHAAGYRHDLAPAHVRERAQECGHLL